MECMDLSIAAQRERLAAQIADGDKRYLDLVADGAHLHRELELLKA